MGESLDHLCVREAEAAIGIPVEEWAGNCHGISELLLTHGVVKGKLRYGHWTGPVSSDTDFSKYPKGLVRHGWIELPDKRIVDPTRYVFESVEPYIYVGENDYYDAGGNVFRKENMRPVPQFSESEKQVILASEDLAEQFIFESLGRVAENGSVPVTIKQAFWLANLPLDILGVAARQIYQALILAEQGALIPFDNQQLVFEEVDRE